MSVSQRTVSRWERGEDSPSLESRKRLRDLGLEPPEVALRNLCTSVKHCPVPRALSRLPRLQLIAVSPPAVLKRPSIADWVGRDLIDIAEGVLQEMLDDAELQAGIVSREIVGVQTTTQSVLETSESGTIGPFRTMISFFSYEGTMYSDAISGPATDDEALGYWPIAAEESWQPPSDPAAR